MVGFGQPSIADVSFRNPRHPVVGIHTLRLKDLYPAPARCAEPNARHRVPVHLLALVTAGRASFTVDFETYPCRPGGLLWVRPGQFVGFPPPGIDATLVLFEPHFPYEASQRARDRARTDPGTPGTYWQPGGEDSEAIVDGVSQLEIDYARILAGGGDIPMEVLRHQLAALLLRLSRLEPEGGPGQAAADSEILARFRHRSTSGSPPPGRSRSTRKLLGCSVRTLTRASLAATGRTAKQLVDDRVALEAKRLLAESDLPGGRSRRTAGLHRADQFRPLLRPDRRLLARRVPAESRRAAAEADLVPATTPPAQPLISALAKAGAARSGTVLPPPQDPGDFGLSTRWMP